MDGCGVALICISGGDGRGRLYDAAAAAGGTGEGEVCQLAGHSDALNWSTFNAACDLIATASDDCSVRIWRPPLYDSINRILEGPAACLFVFQGSMSSGIAGSGHGAAVTAVEFTPDGCCLVSASMDRTLRTWDPKRGKLLRVLSCHGAGVTCVSCSPVSSVAASGSEDGGILLWDIGVDAAKMDRADGARGRKLAEVSIVIILGELDKFPPQDQAYILPSKNILASIINVFSTFLPVRNGFLKC